MASNMLSMKANKKLVQNHLMKTTGKVVLLKDLHNIAAKIKHPQRNDLTKLIHQMKECPGNKVCILGFLFQCYCLKY